MWKISKAAEIIAGFFPGEQMPSCLWCVTMKKQDEIIQADKAEV
jgi:hypothetical protein